MSQTAKQTVYKREPIAIIGIGCRFPGGAADPEQLWQNLLNGVDGIRDIPEDRWDIRKFFDEDKDAPGKMFVKQGGFLQERVDEFDPLFFGMSPREAAVVDPQQKLLLEVSWEAFENAGLTREKIYGSKTGVFVGGFTVDNKLIQLGELNRDLINSHTATSSTMVIMSNRISYMYNLRGPAVTMDTACSSSVIATHYAVQSLRNGDCDMALVGGVNIMLKPDYPIAMCKGGFLSTHARCKAFDGEGNGYTRAEGAGFIVLKPLAKALEDGDRVDAVIIETGANQDGQTAGISLPNPVAQEELVREVYGRAGVSAKDVAYVEAHGTGTKAGDPAELNALNAVFQEVRDVDDKAWVGSIKSNIGHMEAGAGVAGIIKAALTMKHRVVAPNIHFNTPNPAVDFENIRLQVPVKPEPLPTEGIVYSSVNSFGYGGTNAHALLSTAPQIEEIPPVDVTLEDGHKWLVPVSARGDDALRQQALNYVNVLNDKDVTMTDFVYSVSTRRSHHKNRLAIVADSREDLIASLKAYGKDGMAEKAVSFQMSSLDKKPLVFVCTGMGPQWWNMGRELYETEDVYRTVVDKCDALFKKYSGWSILEEMMKDEKSTNMSQTRIAQPANFVIQAGIAALLESHGVVPDAVIGHSVGEVSAAYLSGALSLEDGVLVSYHRSRLQQSVANQGGGMIAIGLSEQDAMAEIATYNDVSIAAINSATAVTLSGNESSLKKIGENLDKRGVFNRALKVEVAYHSSHMDPIHDELFSVLKKLKPQTTTTPLYSTVTGKMIDGKEITADYWWHNARGSVRFADGIRSILANLESCDFVEVGPHPVLKNSIKEVVAELGAQAETVQTLNRKLEERNTYYASLGTMHTIGHSPDWEKLLPTKGHFIDLPSYPWQRDIYWQESARSREDRLGRPGYIYFNEWLRTPNPTWQVEVNKHLLPYLPDHKVDGMTIFPGAGYCDAALAMHHNIFGEVAATITDITLHNVLAIQPNTLPMLMSSFNSESQKFSMHSKDRLDEDGSWKLHATGRIIEKSRTTPFEKLAIDELKFELNTEIDAEKFYRDLDDQGLNYGPWFRPVKEIYTNHKQVLTRIEAHEEMEDTKGEYLLHPTILDASFQSLIAIVSDDDGSSDPFVPVTIDRLSLISAPGRKCYSFGEITKQTESAIWGNITLVDDNGVVLAHVDNLKCQVIPRAEKAKEGALDKLIYAVEWEEKKFDKSAALSSGVVVLAGEEALTAAVTDELKQKGTSFYRVDMGEKTAAVSDTLFTLDAVSSESFKELFALLKSKPFDTLIDLTATKEVGNDVDIELITDALMPLTYTVQAFAANEITRELTITTVTKNGQPFEVDDSFSLITTALTSLGQLVENEHPQLTCRSVDIAALSDALHIVEEALSKEGDSDIVVRGSRRFIRRLVGSAIEDTTVSVETVSTDMPLVADITQPGNLDSFEFRQTERVVPQEGEIEIRIHSASLNFKDLLKVYGQINPKALEDTYFGNGIAMEVSGHVVAVGTGVTRWKVGDEVVTPIVGGGFRTYATVPDFYVIPKASTLTMEEATNTIGFLTAKRAIEYAGRLEKGEKILIHNATGGVGLPAVQVAKEIGAEIYATAGNDEKRDYLRSLGIKHVYDSRSLDFIDHIKRDTGGKGVDVVINAISGDTMIESFYLLAPYGRFVEIGKKDITENTGLPMNNFNRNITFAGIDIDRMFNDRQDTIKSMMEEIVTNFENGTYSKDPVKVFQANEIGDAFRFLGQSRQIGKVIVNFTTCDVEATVHKDKEWLAEDATYMITGGTRGLGLAIAGWLSKAGATRLSLLSRSGAKSAEAKEAIAEMESRGTEVVVEAVDVADSEKMHAVIVRANSKKAPLKGVFHGAMVLEDGFLVNLDRDIFKKVLTPKIMGAWNIHTATQELGIALDFFVNFSSISSLVGNNGQANYVAGNAWLDSFAWYRKSLNLPAQTINWGVLSETGVVSRDDDLEDILAASGIYGLSTDTVLNALDLILSHQEESQVGLFDINWATWLQANTRAAQGSRFAILAEQNSGGDELNEELAALTEELLAVDPEERLTLVAEKLRGVFARVLKFQADKIDMNESISNLGVDSLMTLELSSTIQAEFGLSITSMELLNGPTIMQMADQQLPKIITEEDEILGSLDDMSEEEIDALLAAEEEKGE
ncbi:SDR family NAD(P)-dependent oxidoreductase [bacterium]|nr:SDR family NAD(P)-dependent oxidoreductase [bacterium]